MQPHDAILESAVEALAEKDAEIARLAGMVMERNNENSELLVKLAEQKRKIVEGVHQLFAEYYAEYDALKRQEPPEEEAIVAAIDKACE